MRRNVDGLDYFADRALPHKFTGIDGRLHFEQLAVHDRVDAPGLGDRHANLGKLLQRGQAGLVGEDIFAVFHGTHCDAGAFVGNLRCEHQLHRGTFDDFVLRFDDLYIGKPFAECGQLVVLAAPGRHQLPAAPLYRTSHAVNVVVAHAADGKLDVILGRLFSLHGKNDSFHRVRCTAAKGQRVLRQKSHRSRSNRSHQSCLLQKLPPLSEAHIHRSSTFCSLELVEHPPCQRTLIIVVWTGRQELSTGAVRKAETKGTREQGEGDERFADKWLGASSGRGVTRQCSLGSSQRAWDVCAKCDRALCENRIHAFAAKCRQAVWSAGPVS